MLNASAIEAFSTGYMASPTTQSEQQDAFVHEIAIKLSRQLNIINPNDLLARRVIDIAKNNSSEGFIKGRLWLFRAL